MFSVSGSQQSQWFLAVKSCAVVEFVVWVDSFLASVAFKDYAASKSINPDYASAD